MSSDAGLLNKTVFHIGYHKTGSTWLQNVYYKQHPRIRLINNTVQPWNDRFLKSLIGASERDFDAQVSRALLCEQIVKCGLGEKDVAVVSAERMSGHPSSGGYDSIMLARRIQKVAPEARVFCLVRGQVEMIESVYRQLVFEGYTGKPESLFERKMWKTVGFDLGFYEYDKMYSEYAGRFGVEKVMFAQYECLRNRPEKALEEMARFFGVCHEQPVRDSKAVARSLPAYAVNIVRLMNRYRKTELNPFPLVCMPEFIRSLIVSGLKKSRKKGWILQQYQRDYIKEYFADSNKRMAQHMELDLDAYPR